MGRVTGHVYLVPGWGEHPDPEKRGTKDCGSKYERKAGPAWYMSYRYPSGKQERKLIGDDWPKRSIPPEGYYREKDAQEKLDEKLADLRRGEIPDPGKATGKTFGDAIAELLRYSKDEKGLAQTTLSDYRRVSNGALVEEFGADTPLDQISEDRINSYRSRMLAGDVLAKQGGRTVTERDDAQPISRRSAQKRMVLLGMIFRRAKKLKWIAVDPTADVEAITLRESGDFNVLNVHQVEAVAAKAGIDLSPEEAEQWRAAIVVAAYTGLRTGELRALRWRDINFSEAMIFIRSNMPTGGEEKAPKSAQVRSVPLMDDAAVALDGLSRRPAFTAPNDRVFVDDVGGMVPEDAFREALYAAMEAAGIDRLAFPARKGFVFHDLRHTFGTLAVQVWPLSDVQAYMGHANIQTTMKYVHFVPKTDAAQKFTEAVRRLRDVAQHEPAMAA